MTDGIYTMTYRGSSGDWGMGMLVLRQGSITGADFAGGLYDGRYTVSSANLMFEMVMTVPPGVTLVQGSPAQTTEYKVPFNATIPLDAVEKSAPVLVRLPPGPVNVILKKLRPLDH